MKQYELKDLETGKEYIVAYHNKDKWIPCIVKVVKEYTVKFVRPNEQTHSPLEYGKEYTVPDNKTTDLITYKFKCSYTLNGNEYSKYVFEFLEKIV